MFTMMNHARGDVALQVAHAARAYQIAGLCGGSRSGPPADGSPARLDQHADVRRILDAMDAMPSLGGQ